MAVTVDATAKSTAPSPGTTKSWTHVLGAASNLILVYTYIDNRTPTVSSVTVGGVNATFQARLDEATGTNGGAIELWSLASPPTGSQTITVTWSASGNVSGHSLSFLGSDGTIGVAVTGTGITSPSALTVTSAAGNLVSDGIFQDLGGTCASATLTPGVGQTENSDGALCTDLAQRNTGSTKSGAASVSLAWTLTGDTVWASIGVDVHAAPAGGPVAGLRTLALTGVGR